MLSATFSPPEVCVRFFWNSKKRRQSKHEGRTKQGGERGETGVERIIVLTTAVYKSSIFPLQSESLICSFFYPSFASGCASVAVKRQLTTSQPWEDISYGQKIIYFQSPAVLLLFLLTPMFMLVLSLVQGDTTLLQS